MVPENIHTPTTEGHWKFQGEGVLKAKIFKGMYSMSLNLKFQWGGGFKPKKPTLGGVWVFSATTQHTCKLVYQLS